MLSARWQAVSLALRISSTGRRAGAGHHGFARRHLCQPMYAPCDQACIPDPLWHAPMGRTLLWGSLCGFCCLSRCWSVASSAAVGAPAPLEEQRVCSRHAEEEGRRRAGLLAGQTHCCVLPPNPLVTACHRPQAPSSYLQNGLPAEANTHRKSRPGSGLRSRALIQTKSAKP